MLHSNPMKISHTAFLRIFQWSLFLIFAIGTAVHAQQLTVRVKNTLEFNRSEVVSIERKQFGNFLRRYHRKHIRIKKQGTEAYLPLQWIDNDQDGKYDALLFFADVGAQSASNYIIVADSTRKSAQSQRSAYARFVPERSDDFAWENDRVAFRAYGPKGQKEALQGVAGSTLSSGIDLWFKKVDYSIIDKWYKKHSETPGYYHTDHGEGYDPYHVGKSRGLGGTGLWLKDSLQVSENFTKYKIISEGPLRTVFELTYAPWGKEDIEETKRISLDMGSNFSKFDIFLTAEARATNYSVGIALHDNRGDVKINTEKGWFRYWEPIDGSFVGEGIVMNPSKVVDAFAHVSNISDESHLLIVTKPNDRLTYYAGFAWKKSGQVASVAEWDAMLEHQTLIVGNPLEVTVIK